MQYKEHYTFSDLVTIMEALRHPETGCPWDIRQDFKSIAPYTLEETYEVLDAIRRGDMSNLCEELGDMLLQPVYHAQMAVEAKAFSIQDVLNGICTKMIERHPHVFEDEIAKTAADVNQIWDQKKAEQQAHRQDKTKHLLDDVPFAFPALLRAQKIQSKVAKVGFDWPTTEEIWAKIEEELQEVREAQDKNDSEHLSEELGDLLFVMVNYMRRKGLNAEDVLRAANDKFARRFSAVQDCLTKDQGLSLDQATLEDMERAWRAVKLAEKVSPRAV